ncbi:MAG: hypothetical protein DLM57_14090 [Pseudonocardiales bacterium]|nr:MAG: hypothetical protein DLM57_14090 [Pseudonocardiales bacterium]
MRVPAAFSSAVRPVLTGPIQPAAWLGASAGAAYLMTGSSTVLAIVTHDAVRLPCALVLSTTAAELALSELAPAPGLRGDAPASVGAGRVEWPGRGGPVTVAGTREWAPARVLAQGPPRRAAVAALSSAVLQCDIGVGVGGAVSALALAGDPGAQFDAVAALLGRGPGLTPSGDDVVTGFLLGARAFGRAVPGAAAAVLELARDATSALSAQLLHDAVDGLCIPEVAAAVAELAGRIAPAHAGRRLLAVGHTSGAALAAGLVSAATCLHRPLAVGGAA